jgi:hypothetical protein
MESTSRRLRVRRTIRILMWVTAVVALSALFGLVDVSGTTLIVLMAIPVILFALSHAGPSQRDWSAFHDTYGRAGGEGGPA